MLTTAMPESPHTKNERNFGGSKQNRTQQKMAKSRGTEFIASKRKQTRTVFLFQFRLFKIEEEVFRKPRYQFWRGKKSLIKHALNERSSKVAVLVIYVFGGRLNENICSVETNLGL